MSPSELKLTGKLTAIIAVITVVVNLTVAFTTVKLYTASLMSTIADHESRIRTVETCISGDLSAIKADQAWIVNTLDRQERMLEAIQTEIRQQ